MQERAPFCESLQGRTCARPSARERQAASVGPTRPPERALMNTMRGVSTLSYSGSFLVPRRNSGATLQAALAQSPLLNLYRRS